MAMSYQKVKSVGKLVLTRDDPGLRENVLSTMSTIRSIVGGTLGPGGQPVLIERQEDNMPPIITKDGVTVFRHLGFQDSTSQVILEAARDAAVRTAGEAGDGTTTATILSEAIVKNTMAYCTANKSVSPQRVVSELTKIFKNEIEPLVKSLAMAADLSTEEGRVLLRNVARVSANGDSELADAVMKCFDAIGDAGNVTLTEVSGPYSYEVEQIEGYPINNMGWEDSLGKWAAEFITDKAGQRVYLEKPIFVIYHGRFTEVQSMRILMEKIYDQWQDAKNPNHRHNVIIVATGFSDSVVGQLAFNMADSNTVNIIPLTAPLTPVPGGQLGILEDLCAFTGAKLLDPLTAPLDTATLDDLGYFARSFEMTRFRTTIFPDEAEPSFDGEGNPLVDEKGEIIYGEPPNQLNILGQVSILEEHAKQAASVLDAAFIQERIGKLTGGIARLKVVGSSSGENRERRDRAEDAVCAVRGSIKYGCLPGGGWTLMRIVERLEFNYDPIIKNVLCPALLEPVFMLFENCGMNRGEAKEIVEKLTNAKLTVWNLLENKPVDAKTGGVLDSVPAVLEALRNSLSIATLLGTLGGTIVFGRDSELDRQEARETRSFLHDAEPQNPANERGL